MCNTIALTIGIHPATLGILADSDGLITMPPGFELIISHVVDLFEWRGGKAPTFMTLKGENEPAPPHILSIEPRLIKQNAPGRTMADLKAVVMVEHRSIKVLVEQAMKDTGSLEGVITVMVYGTGSNVDSDVHADTHDYRHPETQTAQSGNSFTS